MPYKDPKQASAYAKEYYERHKEKAKAVAKQHYEKDKAKHRRLTKAWLADHYDWQLWKRAKDSSKQRQLEFDILPTDITIPSVCPYLGIALTTLSDGGRQESNASLDRIDNNKGYVKGNIQVISSKANFMKRNASIEELRRFALGILRTHPE